MRTQFAIWLIPADARAGVMLEGAGNSVKLDLEAGWAGRAKL
jgi:hypothetical protein